MKRRAFFGFAAGAAVAGPGMAKAAAAKVVEDLALGQGTSALVGGLGYSGSVPFGGFAGAPIDGILRAQNMLSKIAGLSAAERAKKKRQMHVGALDPDLAAYRSLSIGARIDMQRERNLERLLSERKGMWEILAGGGDPYADDPL